VSELFHLNSDDVKSFKEFVSIGSALDVKFYVTHKGVMAAMSAEGYFVANRFFALPTHVDRDTVEFILRRDAFLRALSVFEHMSVFDNGGCVKLVSKDYEVNLYKAGYVSLAGSKFVDISEGAKHITKEDAKFIHEGFNLAKVPLSHMMKSISLGAKSSYLGKIHYVELDTPCFDFDGAVQVEQSFIGYLKGVVPLGDDCFVHCDEKYVYLSVKKDGEVVAQCRAETNYEPKSFDILDVGKALNQKQKFVLSINKAEANLGEVFDVFSISLCGITEKELSLTLEDNRLIFTSFDLGHQPTKVSVPVTVESGGLENPVVVTYQSLVDIFNRDTEEYKVSCYESVMLFETDRTKDLLVTLI
jgi:hypothetical protein